MKKQIILIFLLAWQLSLWSQDTIMYRGGYHDGSSVVGITNFTPTMANQFYTYTGGNGDGASTSGLSNFLPMATNQSFQFKGGTGDGADVSSLITFTPNITNQFVSYLGETGDGFNVSTLNNFVPSYRTQFTPYAGNVGDGYAGALTTGYALPIHLLSFEGKAYDGFNILKWKVSEDESIAHYELERSGDGSQFQYLSTIIAKKSTHVNYEYNDKQPMLGANYYKLKLVDEKEESSYSNVILLMQYEDGKAISIYPNPTTANVYIAHNYNTDLQYALYDITGKPLQQGQISKNASNQAIQLEQYPQGAYLIKVLIGNTEQVFKIIKQ